MDVGSPFAWFPRPWLLPSSRWRRATARPCARSSQERPSSPLRPCESNEALCNFHHRRATRLMSATASAKDFDHARICEAIRKGLELRVFHRAGESERVAIPRFLGYTRVRNVILNGLQVSGFSESGNLPGHRSFRLDRATDIQFTANVVPSHPGSGKLPSGIVELVCARH